MKTGFWTTDWFLAAVISLGLGGGAWLASGLVERWQLAIHDFGRGMSSAQPDERIAVIAIDERSAESLGPWPWSRNHHAEIIEFLHRAGARAVASTVPLSTPNVEPGLAHIEQLTKTYAGSGTHIPGLGRQLMQARQDLDTDARLAASVRTAGNVVLGIRFQLGEPGEAPPSVLPEYLAARALDYVPRAGAAESRRARPPLARMLLSAPIPEIAQPTTLLGHVNWSPDADGVHRAEPLVVGHGERYFPSLALAVVAASLGLGPEAIAVDDAGGARLGELEIRADSAFTMRPMGANRSAQKPVFPVDSFSEVLARRVAATRYRDKIVLIGFAGDAGTVPGRARFPTGMPDVMSIAHSVAGILDEALVVAPGWGRWMTLAAYLAVCVFLIVALPRLPTPTALLATAGTLCFLALLELGLLLALGLWIKLLVPAVVLAVGYLAHLSRRLGPVRMAKLKSQAPPAESNRMLGLAHQGNGDLDAAYACFRNLPVDESVMDLLYNLALDYEGNGRFEKAVAVYRYLAEFDPGYRDIQARMTRGPAADETVKMDSIVGHPGTAPPVTQASDGSQHPMLGRYQVEKELGKGSMGVVYLGRDPKLNRVVAIKTMALSEEFEEDELEEVKSRFFREAETAGRLNHPNIVTIFDAGEELDLAFIAMEYLEGEDLTSFTGPEELLPVADVLEIVIKAADALDYAHGQNVVHRDIKPANIMYEPATGNVKLPDFGIARITDSSKTKTGMVLGTPSYMSPEQLSGKQVDGRSDLFSLGVMLYQLLTGTLPFSGDSMAKLMYSIANEPHPDVLERRADLPSCLKAVLDKALQKLANNRYSRGAEMVRDLRACVSHLERAA